MENSPLDKLPAELRYNIAELALTHGTCHVHAGLRHARPIMTISPSKNRATVLPAGLTQTCKQLKIEYRRLFFAINNFELHLPSHLSTPAQRVARDIAIFLSLVGPDAAASMRRLDINLLYRLSYHIPCQGAWAIFERLKTMLEGFKNHPDSINLLTGRREAHLRMKWECESDAGIRFTQSISLDAVNLRKSLKTENAKLFKLLEAKSDSSDERLMLQVSNRAFTQALAKWEHGTK